MRAELSETPWRYTTMYESPVTLTYFELDRRDAALWPGGGRVDVDALLDAATRRWAALPPPPPADPAARARVEELCDTALRRLEAGAPAEAKEMLAAAVEQNAKVHSPLVYQYVANVAVLGGDLLVAVGAQKEALRLAPDNDLYRRNLRHLLVVPYKEGTAARDGEH
jgi:hypothetical protein